MPTLPRVTVNNRKIDAVKRFHPWIFSGALRHVDPVIREGDLVDAYSESGEYLATGLYGTGSIAVKILSFEPVPDVAALILARLRDAFTLRDRLGLTDNPHTTCYRLINSEGDGLPGAIADWYDGTVVLQAHSAGMHALRSQIVAALRQVYGDRLRAVYDKSTTVLPAPHLQVTDGYLWGEPPRDDRDRTVLENGYPFVVYWEEGQKTGFFLDQRENRAAIERYAAGKRLLNAFCYSGGFSAYAARAGAAYICSVDSSARAIEWATHNVACNNPQQVPHELVVGDVMAFLRDCDPFDTIVLDPPAFAKSLSARHQAIMAYRRLNERALLKLRPQGTLVTFSCSQVVDTDSFTGAVTAAAIAVGRPVRVLQRLTQPADHPTSIFHPEGAYLKGLVLGVD